MKTIEQIIDEIKAEVKEEIKRELTQKFEQEIQAEKAKVAKSQEKVEMLEIELEYAKEKRFRNGDKVDQFDKQGHWIATYNGLSRCAEINGLNVDTLRECVKGNRSEYREYVYKYTEEIK